MEQRREAAAVGTQVTPGHPQVTPRSPQVTPRSPKVHAMYGFSYASVVTLAPPQVTYSTMDLRFQPFEVVGGWGNARLLCGEMVALRESADPTGRRLRSCRVPRFAQRARLQRWSTMTSHGRPTRGCGPFRCLSSVSDLGLVNGGAQ